MPNFEAQGKHYETGKMQKRTYKMPTETDALHRALADGMIVESIRRVSDEPPTDRQLAYAKDLGIVIPPGITKDEISEAIAVRVESDVPSTEKHRASAQKYNVEFTQYVGKIALFDRIFNAIKSPGRENDLISWFTYRVYCDLMHGKDDGPIDSPHHQTVQEIASDLSKFDNVINSIKRYNGRDLFSFGEWTSPDGETRTGGSDRTIAYKMVSAALRQRIDFPSSAKAQQTITDSTTSKKTSNTLKTCRDCGKPISKSAGRCPHCGARHDYGSYAWALIIAIALAAIMSMIFKCGN